MKFSKLSAMSLMAVAVCTLAACSGNDDATKAGSATSTSSTGAPAATVQLPTPEELNAVLNLAADPNAPIEQRTQTVQNGESAPELFAVMAKSRDESHAQFQVVPPILPGYTPNSVLATVNFILPEREAQPAENVEFVYENNKWKLSQTWACTLIEYTVPDQVPPMCTNNNGAAAPAPAAPAESGVPAAPAAPAADGAAPAAPAAPNNQGVAQNNQGAPAPRNN